MDKPKEKHAVGIKYTRHSPHINPTSRSIAFETNKPNIPDQLKEFGQVTSYGKRPTHGHLTVSICYDYDEVLEYVASLGKDKPEKKKADRRYAIGQAAYMCFSCKLTDCPYRWDKKMNINDPEFMTCPFRERQDT